MAADMKISIEGADKVSKRLDKLDGALQKAVDRTMKDVARRAPGWISKGVRAHYGVDTAAIKEAGGKPKRGKFSASIAGTPISGLEITYRGRQLTLSHFKFTPKEKPKRYSADLMRVEVSNGEWRNVRRPKEYTIKATVIKGQKTEIKDDKNGYPVFMADVSGHTLPARKTAGYRATGQGYQAKSIARQKYQSIRRLSVPQMIDGLAREGVMKNIEEGTRKRFENAVDQAVR